MTSTAPELPPGREPSPTDPNWQTDESYVRRPEPTSADAAEPQAGARVISVSAEPVR